MYKSPKRFLNGGNRTQQVEQVGLVGGALPAQVQDERNEPVVGHGPGVVQNLVDCLFRFV